MEWSEVLASKSLAGTAHEFVLYLNTKDLAIDGSGSKLVELNDFLLDSEPIKQAAMVVSYNRFTNLRFARPKMEELFVKLLEIEKDEFELGRRKYMRVLEWLDKILHLSWKDHVGSREVSEIAYDVLGEETDQRRGMPLIAVIFEYAEGLVPQDASSAGDEDNEDRKSFVAFSQWAKDEKIRASKNLIILLAEDLNSIPANLRSPSSGVVPLKIAFPDLPQRGETIKVIREECPRREGDIGDRILAQFTAGLTQRAIRGIVEEADFHKTPLTIPELFSIKKKILEEQSGGLIEIKRPPWTAETIGDLEGPKRYIFQVVSLMERGERLATPMGLLLVGAPGTGKTIFVEVLAHEIGMPLVVLRNIREMWVGQSERNLDMVFELIRAQAPVVVFQDEFDLAMPARGAASYGDSGSRVDDRMMGEYFKFMSDTTLRGRVIWVCATNRPDRLDQAMLRPGRFDEIIPFPTPVEAEERKSIVYALLKKMEIQARESESQFIWELSPEDILSIAQRTCGYLSKVEQRFYREPPKLFNDAPDAFEILPYTGAEIEDILRKALFLARSRGDKVLKPEHINKCLTDFPFRDFAAQKVMNDMALMMATSMDFLSEKWRKRVLELRSRPIRRTAED